MKSYFIIFFILFLSACGDNLKIVPDLLEKESFEFELLQGDLMTGINFLFIVDDSGSMDDQKKYFSDNIVKVLDPIFKAYPFYEYNFFIVSMGFNKRGDIFRINKKIIQEKCNIKLDNLIKKSTLGSYISFKGQTSKKDIICAISQNIQGTEDLSEENFFKPFHYIIDNIESDFTLNSIFFSKDKLLVPFFISDSSGDDLGKHNDMILGGFEIFNNLIDRLSELKLSINNIRSFAIVPPKTIETKECMLDPSVETHPIPYHVYQLVKETKGKVISICDNEWGNQLKDISKNLLKNLSIGKVLYFDKVPQPETIEVFLNNRKVEEDINKGWYLDKEKLSLNFGFEFDLSYYRFQYESNKTDKVIVKYNPMNIEVLQNSEKEF